MSGDYGKGGLSGGQIASLTRLKAAAAAALSSNPVTNLDMASPPTTTQSGTHDATLTVQANPSADPAKFLSSPGIKHIRTGTNGLYIGTSNLAPAQGNLNAVTNLVPLISSSGEESICYAVTFMATSRYVEAILRPPGSASTLYRIIVDDHFVARDGISVASQFVKMDFGNVATRKITIETEVGQTFLGVAVEAGGVIAAPTYDQIKSIAYGDSITRAFTNGTLPTVYYTFDGWASTFAKLTGMEVRNAGVDGSGYLNTFAGNASKLYDQMDFSIATETVDVVKFMHGYNDVGNFTNAAIAAEALRCWQRARSAQPNALLIVFGVPSEATGPSAAVIATENALKAQFTAWADPFAMFVPFSTDPDGPWFTGTGYVGHENGTGNSDIYISPDHVHPVRAGEIYMGGKANASYRTRLAAM